MSAAAALWTPTYIAIGSNLDDPIAQVQAAFAQLAKLPQSLLVARSRLYRTAPLGPQDQPDFINAAAGLLTQLDPQELLRALKRIEAQMGRERIERWGPRRIDLDLIMYGAARIQQDDLTVPHPGAASRNFVLYPLCDFAPSVLLPGHGRLSALAARVGSSGLAPVQQSPE
ncbi:MAG TPA: 2-amino-4-hydroxy-6-hydroxymethyldihydropteridine diphosphokinase [Steroidobacter sp.]|nr:2-amino-4-hydroxy-6-hydroxymethyldihydropteridine diphosphokinase [Steroidobacteraceae bacterium]HLS80214.1 2-amino-4-hydroxy-6-hydroxymethyldihydropteridine diphosphokinase [Steroidobacter sp.]